MYVGMLTSKVACCLQKGNSIAQLQRDSNCTEASCCLLYNQKVISMLTYLSTFMIIFHISVFFKTGMTAFSVRTSFRWLLGITVILKNEDLNDLKWKC